MVLGDGIRRNIASVEPSERTMLRDTFIQLNNHFFPGNRNDSPVHQATHVHNGPEFIPWHREIVNRLEQMLRQINPQLSLHYWDWTQDPRSIPNANLGGGQTGPLNLFTSDFTGHGGQERLLIGESWLTARYYVPEANPDRTTSKNPADPLQFVTRSVRGSPASVVTDHAILNEPDYAESGGW